MNKKELVFDTVDFIEQNLASDLTLDQVAEKAGYSKYYLNRVFQEVVGHTIIKYIQLRRLSIAANKLVYSNKPIIDVAYDAGYQSQQAFGYAFRQVYILAPMAYRMRRIYQPAFDKYASKVTMFVSMRKDCGVMAA